MPTTMLTDSYGWVTPNQWRAYHVHNISPCDADTWHDCFKAHGRAPQGDVVAGWVELTPPHQPDRRPCCLVGRQVAGLLPTPQLRPLALSSPSSPAAGSTHAGWPLTPSTFTPPHPPNCASTNWQSADGDQHSHPDRRGVGRPEQNRASPHRVWSVPRCRERRLHGHVDQPLRAGLAAGDHHAGQPARSTRHAHRRWWRVPPDHRGDLLWDHSRRDDRFPTESVPAAIVCPRCLSRVRLGWRTRGRVTRTPPSKTHMTTVRPGWRALPIVPRRPDDSEVANQRMGALRSAGAVPAGGLDVDR